MLKRIRLFSLFFVAILWFAIILPYLLVQTAFGARYASQLISYYSDNYSISIGNVSHSILKPYEIELENLTIQDKTKTITYLSAKKVALILKKEDLLQTHELDYLLIDNGYMQYQSTLPMLKINDLQLKNISLDYVDKSNDNTIILHNISGRIAPWSSQVISGDIDSQFMLTIANAEYSKLSMQSIFIEGVQKNKTLELTSFGGDVDHGFFTIKGLYLSDNDLKINQLRLNKINVDINDISIQQHLRDLPKTTISQLSIINSNLATPDIIIEKANLEAQNIGYNHGWQVQSSEGAFNAQSIVWHDELIESPLLQWYYDNNKTIINQGIASWHNGNIQLSGNWQHNKLTIDNLLAGGFRYQLPLDWYRTLNSSQLADVLPAQIEVKQFTLMPSLIIDTNPYLPFQFTAFQAFGNNINIYPSREGLQTIGTILVKAESGTLNTVELHKPDLTLNLTPENHQLTFSTLIEQGILEGQANFVTTNNIQSLTLTAHTVDSQVLSLWHLINNPIKADQYSVEFNGDLQPLSLNGRFSANDQIYSIENNQLIDH